MFACKSKVPPEDAVYQFTLYPLAAAVTVKAGIVALGQMEGLFGLAGAVMVGHEQFGAVTVTVEVHVLAVAVKVNVAVAMGTLVIAVLVTVPAEDATVPAETV